MILFLDLDGVLADFEKRVKEITGFGPGDFGRDRPGGSKSKMWKQIANPAHDFYNSLDWMPDGEHLFDNLKHHSPIILSGVAMGNWSKPQKRTWIKRMLGEEVPHVLCFADDKPKAALEFLKVNRGWQHDTLKDCILVDDREKTQQLWENYGGTYVLHKNAVDSINQVNEILKGIA